MLKLNGGLGTGMGLEKAKSLLTLRDRMTFLDFIAKQATLQPCNPTWPKLQPFAARPATLCVPVCNPMWTACNPTWPMWPRLQPHVALDFIAKQVRP